MDAEAGAATPRLGWAAGRLQRARAQRFWRWGLAASLLLALLSLAQAGAETHCDRAPEDRPLPEILYSERVRYPPIAIREGWHGEVRVRLLLNAEGAVAESEIAQSSGFEPLDREALRVAGLRRYSPAECGEHERELIFPILFLPPEHPPASSLERPVAAGG